MERDTIVAATPVASSASARDSLVGRTLGDFVVAEKIGEGGFGAVYRAHQPLLDRPAVIKVLHTRLRATAAERFLREARLASRLDHPYAAHIYAFGAEPDGTLWIAMELVRGTALSEYLKTHGPLGVERFVPLLERICEVVHTAHEQKIIHRDLKPANVMIVTRAGRLLPKLLDFGIAKSLLDATIADAEPEATAERKRDSNPSVAIADTITPAFDETVAPASSPIDPPDLQPTGRSLELTQQGAVMGSPHYMAPEQWRDAAAVTARTDLYALGILAYEALAGAPPFRGTSVSALAAAHADDAVPALPRGPAALDAVIARALAKRPDDRFGSALEMAAAFRSAAGLADEQRPLPQLDEAVQQHYIADAPQPLAEAIAALESARDPRQARDALWAIPAIFGRWLAVVALAARSRLGPSRDGPGTLAAVRELGTSAPDDDAWIEAAYALARGYADKPDLHPIPELVLLACAPDGSPGDGLALYRELVAHRPGVAETTANADEVIARLRPALATLSALLRRAAFVCKYAVVVALGDGFAERWSGTRRPQRVQVVARGAPPANVPLIVDQDGAPVVALHPIVQVAEPAPGVARELFLYAGRDARGVKLTAPPTAYERHDAEVLEWLRVQLASTLDSDRGAKAAERAPYRGLAAFTVDDAALFIGREHQVDAFLNRLRMQPLVAVVGPSGAGKSSFVQAGLVPALGETWRSIIVRPGPAPFVALASRLVASGVGDHELASQLRDDPGRLGELLRGHARDGGPIVLVVDQLEELFTLSRDEAERERFAIAMAAAARATDDPVRVVVTLRDDFLAATQSLESLRDRFAHGLQLLTTPSRADLERILVEPARRMGYEFEDPALPARMVDEVAERPGALALLSFTAAQLWEQRDRHFKRLSTKSYDELGGVGGALARHADAVLADASAHEQQSIREAFRHLVTAEGTRAVLKRGELVAVLGGGSSAENAVERLIASRLLVAREGDADEQIEIVHEALISAWPRLVEWRREDAEGARLRDQLRTAARLWDSRDRPDDLLWRGEALLEYQLWRPRYPGALTAAEDAFGAASLAVAARGRRMRRAAVAVVIAALSVGLGVLFSLRQRAEEARGAAVAERLRAQALANAERERVIAQFVEQGRRLVLENNAARALVFLHEAHAQGSRDPALPYLLALAERPVTAQLRSFEGHTGQLRGLELDGDGTHAVTASKDGTARIWELASGRSVVLAGATDQIDVATFDPRSLRVLTASYDGKVRVYERDGRLVYAIDGPPTMFTAAWSGDGKLVAAGGRGDVMVWDAGTGRLLHRLAHGTSVRKLAFAVDGALMVSAFDGSVALWDPASGRKRMALVGHADSIWTGAFSADGRWLATASLDGVTIVWDARSGARRHRIQGHNGMVEHLAFSPDGRWLATASRDRTARIWDLDDGQSQCVIAGHAGAINHVDFDSSGRRLITASADQTAAIWDVNACVRLVTLHGHGAAVRMAAFTTDGRAVTASFDGTAKLWETSPSPLVAILAGHTEDIKLARWSPDGKRVLTGSNDKTLRIWNLDGTTAALLHGHSDKVNSAAWTADGNAIVSAGDDGEVRIWDGATGRPIHILAGHVGRVWRVTPSPDGKTVASVGADGNMRFWDRVSATPIRTVTAHTPHQDVYVLAYSPAGDRVLSAAIDGHVKLWNAVGELVLRLSSNGRVLDGGFSPDGQLVLTASTDNQARLYSAVTGQQLVSLHHGGIVTAARFDASGERVVTASEDGSIRIWDTRTGKRMQVLEGHASLVFAATFDPSGELVASGGDDHTVRLWESHTGRELARFTGHAIAVADVAFDPTGTRVVTFGFDRKAMIWSIERSRKQPAEIARLLHCFIPFELIRDQLQARTPITTACPPK